MLEELCKCFGVGKKRQLELEAEKAVADAEREAANGRQDSETAQASARKEGAAGNGEGEGEDPAPLLSEQKSLVAPPQKPLSSKAAAKVCYYLVSHFFGRSMQYKPELLRLSEQIRDFRVISSDKFKAFLDAAKIMVPKDKMGPIARYYAPPASPRTSEVFDELHGNLVKPDHQKAIMMDVDHLLLDLDKAAMRYYLNKNTQEDDVKPSANVDLARVTELVFQMLVEDPAFANREISDEEEIRIEELIASVDMSTVCIPTGTRARTIKANLANIQAGSSSLRQSLRQGSTTLMGALGGVARLPSLADYMQRNLSKREKEEAPQDSQLVFDVPAWSLRAMQTRQGERNAHLQVQKGAPSLSTPQSQQIQNMLRKRSLFQQQEILAHAISGAVKAVMLADGKGVEGKDAPDTHYAPRWSDSGAPISEKPSAASTFARNSSGPTAAASAAVNLPKKPSLQSRQTLPPGEGSGGVKGAETQNHAQTEQNPKSEMASPTDVTGGGWEGANESQQQQQQQQEHDEQQQRQQHQQPLAEPSPVVHSDVQQQQKPHQQHKQGHQQQVQQEQEHPGPVDHKDVQQQHLLHSNSEEEAASGSNAGSKSGSHVQQPQPQSHTQEKHASALHLPHVLASKAASVPVESESEDASAANMRSSYPMGFTEIGPVVSPARPPSHETPGRKRSMMPEHVPASVWGHDNALEINGQVLGVLGEDSDSRPTSSRGPNPSFNPSSIHTLRVRKSEPEPALL